MSVSRREIAGWSIRWDERRAVRARADGHWLDTTIGEASAKRAASDPDRVLVIDGDRRVTAGELHAAALRLAGGMRARGLAAGDVVSFMLPNWHEACAIYLAASMLGLVVHPLVPAYRDAEITFMLADCDSRMMFIPARFRDFDYAAMMKRVAAAMPRPPEIVVLRGDAGGFTPYEAMLAQEGAENLPKVDPDSVRMVLYTSGTTGRPKGVLHTHNTINADIVQIHRNWHVDGDARFFVPSPISHIGGSLYAFEMPLLFGVAAVLLDLWDAKAAVAIIDRERCTHMAGATPFLQQILAEAKAAGTRLPSLRVFICGGASVPPQLIREAASWFENCIVTRCYGSTEVPTITVGAMAKGDIDHGAETDGAIGFADVRIAGGAEGEILARAPQMLVGYLHREDEKDAFDADGYFRMGDLGRIVDDRFVVISGRQKDIIIRHGENISPKEIEDILIQHPAVDDIAVVGLPDAGRGEIACAIVVARAGAAPSVADLAAFLAARGVARFKHPERVELRADLPRNTMGKVLKHELRAALIAFSDD